MTDDPEAGGGDRGGRARLTAILMLWIGMVTLGVIGGRWVQALVAEAVLGMDGRVMLSMLAATLALYVCLSALPFVPGAEIGFALLVLIGAPAAPVVWLGMVGALSLAFLAGRRVSGPRFAAGLERLGLGGTADRMRRLARLEEGDRTDLLLAMAPQGWGAALLRRRALTLALLLNLPGNTAIGGGGGISFAAGASGLFAPATFVATVALAAAPMPLAFVLAEALSAAP